MDSLPIEMWHYIFNYLTSDDLLNCREICRKWNTISLATFKWSNLNIGFRNNKDVAEFCEMMKQSSGGLKFCNFYLKFDGNKLICEFNLTRLSKEIGPYAVSYYFYIGDKFRYEIDTEYVGRRFVFRDHIDTINIMLKATPNLRMLNITTEHVFPKPNFRPLKKLEELQLKQVNFTGLGSNTKIELDIVANWIMKAPSLKKFHSNFRSTFQNSGEMSQYFQLLKEIPEVCMYVELYQNHERHLKELQSVQITELFLEMEKVGKGEEVCSALYSLLKKQSRHLRTLRIQSISGITNFTLPFLPKLATFETIQTDAGDERKDINFSQFDPKNLPRLQKLNLDHELSTKPLHNPFIRGEYSTVTKLILWTYSIQDWRKMFPRLRKLTTTVIQTLRFDMLKHLLANPPANYLVLTMSTPEVIDYLIANPSSVPKIRVNLDYTNTTEYKIKLWNAITGSAWIESESILSIKGINDIQVPHETGTKRTIADIKNLWKLRLFDSEEVLKGFAYLSQKQVSFSSLKKLTLIESNEYKTRYVNLRKLSTWNFNWETRYYDYENINSASYNIIFSEKKIPEFKLLNILNRSKKYVTRRHTDSSVVS